MLNCICMGKETFDDFDFDLPEVEAGATAMRPRIHVGGSVCLSCEG